MQSRHARLHSPARPGPSRSPDTRPVPRPASREAPVGLEPDLYDSQDLILARRRRIADLADLDGARLVTLPEPVESDLELTFHPGAEGCLEGPEGVFGLRLEGRTLPVLTSVGKNPFFGIDPRWAAALRAVVEGRSAPVIGYVGVGRYVVCVVDPTQGGGASLQLEVDTRAGCVRAHTVVPVAR